MSRQTIATWVTTFNPGSRYAAWAGAMAGRTASTNMSFFMGSSSPATRPDSRGGRRCRGALTGAQSYRIALMRAEHEPLECHRALLVAPELEKAGIAVVHVHADGRTESHSDAMSRPLDLFRLTDEDLFRSRSELIEEACYRQQKRVA